jgi:hypothetical protein
LADCIDRGLNVVRDEQETIREYVKDIEEVAATLEPGVETCAARQEKLEELIDLFERTEDPIRQQMAKVMISFLAGLFVGEGKFEEIKDNLDLERWFRLPKSHERKIHGHRHAGIRIVVEGPTLVHALDAHAAHCHRALQNQPLMGASKPATVFGVKGLHFRLKPARVSDHPTSPAAGFL